MKFYHLICFLLFGLQSFSQLTCNNWLLTPSLPAYVTVGDVDVSGNQLTVEANVNRIPPVNNPNYFGGHVIAKHTGPSNVNYALAITGCEITTTNGYTHTNNVCPESLNKTYHLAMVYDGSKLKFYRNGYLMNEVPCTGNMVTNNLLTTIAQVSGNGYPGTDQFYGYMNEVRIWNVARTQSQIRTYMNSSLPNPTTQTGLLAYYTFDNLINKQGNASYNGTLAGSASINNINPQCTLVIDTCNIIAPPDFTPTIDISSLSFTENASRDFLVNISNISPNATLGTTEFKITKLSAFNITWSNTSGISNVLGPVQNNNSDWVITDGAFFISVMLKPTATINPSGFNRIGFNIARKAGIASNTTQNLTGIIVSGSGGDSNSNNNTANTIMTAL